MSDSTFTLRNIFSLSSNSDWNQALEEWPEKEQDIPDEFKNVDLSAAMPNLSPKVDELFDIEVPNLFVTAWNKTGEIQGIIDKSRDAPEEVIYVELADHSIESEHHPYVEMTIRNSPPVKIIELTVKLTMTIKGFQLKIQGGEIKEIGTGTCEAEGTIEYKGLVIMKKNLEPVRLPGS
ncbi:MAG: hypothetical protein OEQ28_15980, partial [Acidobacteriota bacterium]|nr:hypothetical protein [Acidobacteriota bacterium]